VISRWEYSETDYPTYRAWEDRNRNTDHIHPCGCHLHREETTLLWVGDVRVVRATGEIVERFEPVVGDVGVTANSHVVEWLVAESIKVHPGCHAGRVRQYGDWVVPA